MSDEELIEAAPCPQCRSPLTVAAADLGQLVECPTCSTQFRARRKVSGSGAAPRRDESRSRWDDEGRDEPRERRRLSRSERDRDRDDEDDSDDRPRRRFENDYDEQPRRRARPGSLTAIAVMNFIYAGLCMLCGILGTIGLLFKDAFQVPGAPDPNMAIEIPLMIGYWAAGIVMIFAGIFALKRQGYALCITGIALACLQLILGVVNAATNLGNMPGAGAPEQGVGFVCGVGLIAIFWLGYIVTNGILLAKGGRHFR